jgi:23S rRNA (cytosine1962-C5)-methyltransferase
MPGLIVDRYNDVLVVQFLTAGVERARTEIIDALKAVLSPAAIFEKSDTASRNREGLGASTGWMLGDATPEVEFVENGLSFAANLVSGQKTGFYLDQRNNRVAAAKYAKDRDVLDAFSYTGAFAVSMGRAGAKSLTLADSSAPSLDLARKNLERNGIDPGAVEIAQEDVSGLLRLYRHEGRRFDMVVLDPPKFASNRHQLDKAKRAYKDVNMISMGLLNPGGILVTFSCSGAVSSDDFTIAVSWAGIDAHREVQVLERLSQPPDHPVLASFPESEYLKGLICRVC